MHHQLSKFHKIHLVLWGSLYRSDPYYLIHKSRMVGFEPKIITAGRKINDDMHLNFSDSLLTS